MTGGLRYNKGKNQLDLVPPEWVWALGDVTTKGSEKYLPRNWELGMKWSIPVGCCLRHLTKFVMGERYDPETGCHHLAMAAWNLLALMTYDIREIGEDDLPKLDLRLLDRVNQKTSDMGQKSGNNNLKDRTSYLSEEDFETLVKEIGDDDEEEVMDVWGRGRGPDPDKL